MILKLLLFFLFLHIYIYILQQEAAAYNFSKVEYLPGFGLLPFHLETGYIGVGKNEEVQMFYYFFPSENDPITDPLLIWLSGGPGCSGASAIFGEIGPLRFVEKPFSGRLPKLVPNTHSWTKIANIIFLDQPANTGLSYATNSDAAKYTDLRACDYVYEFLRKWFSDHPQFLSNSFYVAGNSYSGITAPIVTQLISNGITAGNEPLINLQGYILGNPATTHPFDYFQNYQIPFSHGMGYISDELYESLKKCKGEYTNVDSNNISCANDKETFFQLVDKLNWEHTLYPDCSKVEGYGLGDDNLIISLNGRDRDPCAFHYFRLIKYWANDPEVQEALHVRKGTITNWVRCRSIRLQTYTVTINNSVPYHANLSAKGYRSLIHSGDHDFSVPFQGTQAWIRSLNYSIVDDWRPWSVNDQVAGYTRSYSNKMTFATVKRSGHGAATYKPEECFVMLKRWINHEPL